MNTLPHTVARKLALSLLAASTMLAGAAHAMPHPFSALDTGMLVNAQGERNIEINANTRAVNVTNGETVSFTVGGQHFTYAFNAWDTIGAIDLSAIAPKDVTVPAVRVYIARNPLSQG